MGEQLKRVEEVTIRRDGPVLHVAMDRPERRNALSRSMVRGLSIAFGGVQEGDGIRVVVLSGNGPSFCAGGDLQAYRAATETGDGRESAEALADLLILMDTCRAPVIARVHGAAFGGGVGLACATDIAIASSEARFSLSEARLGLVPAAIAPYVLRALGRREAMAKMLLAAPFDADEALRCHLVQRVVAANELDAAVSDTVDQLLQCAPGALALIKRIPERLDGNHSSTREITTSFHMERLASPESKEGLQAFFDKRAPEWAPEKAKSR